MKWFIGFSNDIIVEAAQLQARREFISKITKSEVSLWERDHTGKFAIGEFLHCTSKDGVDGVFITGHIGDVFKLCEMRKVSSATMIVANTCIWEPGADTALLRFLRRANKNTRLWFAKQEIMLDSVGQFRQTATLRNVGKFGFQTSLSERLMFSNREMGFEKAIQASFEKVSPIKIS